MPDAGASSAPAAALTPRRVPEGYVRAEVATFPLTSEQAFRDGITFLDPALEERGVVDREIAGDDQERTTRKLWRACEERLILQAGGWSLDRLVAVRDQTWFAPESADRVARVPMHHYLRHLAHAHVERQTGASEVHRSPDANELNAIIHYYWLSFSIPQDLVLAAVDIEPPPRRVGMENVLLMRGLTDRGVAEIHQHVGAGMDFPMLWAAALAALAGPELSPGALTGPGVPLEGEMLRWLVVAALTRVVLMEFLLARESAGTDATLRDYVVRLHAHNETRGARTFGGWATFLRALRSLVIDPNGPPPPFEAMQALYGDWHPRGRTMAYARPRSVDEAWRSCDPIAVRLGLTAPSAGERWLVRNGLAYLEWCDRNDRPDPFFAASFWQTMRIRCLYYRHIVQRPLTAGLQWFIRYQGHVGELTRPLVDVRPEVAFRVAGEIGGTCERIRALEARVSGEETAAALGEKLRTMLRSWCHVLETIGGDPRPEFGVVAHFLKERDELLLWKAGRPEAFGEKTYAQPRRSWPPVSADGQSATERPPVLPDRELRFGSYLREQARTATAIAELLREVHGALWLVRGIDVANDELGVPTWVLVPLYRYMRQEAAYASVLPGNAGVPTLRTTAHVGEDFRHLMEGLRRVFEATEYLLAANGSRIGHATALGVDPRVWAESAGSLLMPKEDRLWDLVFEWRLYAGFHVPPEFLVRGPPGRQALLTVQIADLAREIYGDDHHTYAALQLAQLHHDLHEFMVGGPGRTLLPGDISVARGLKRISADGEWQQAERAQAVARYLADARVFNAGQELIEVTLSDADVASLTAVQDAIRRGVAARGIVVELNPTSNLLIGDMLDLRNHPILRLFPIEPEGGPPPVPIAIGSDDPVTFNTSLLREYGLLYYTARGAGHSDRVVQDWLDRVRKTSMDARFTVPWRPNAPARAAQLLEAFDRYLQKPRTRESYLEHACV